MLGTNLINVQINFFGSKSYLSSHVRSERNIHARYPFLSSWIKMKKIFEKNKGWRKVKIYEEKFLKKKFQ